MPFKIQVGPAQTSIHQGRTIFVTEPDGQVNWPSDMGLYFLDTRVLSNWNIYANGEPWTLLNGGAVNYFSSRTYLTNRTIVTEDGEIAPRTLGFVIGRSISGGMHEDLEITNNNLKPVRFQLEVAIRCDFADIFEVKSGRIVRRGRITTEWSQQKQELSTCYTNADFARSLTVTLASDQPRAVYANGRLSFEVNLGPGEVWCCCLLYTLGDGKEEFAPPKECAGSSHHSSNAGSMSDWLQAVLKIRTSNEEFYRLYHQALEDIPALRLPLPGTDHVVFLPAAGVPWFVAPFGRDSLIVALQNLLIYPEFARGALEILGSNDAIKCGGFTRRFKPAAGTDPKSPDLDFSPPAAPKPDTPCDLVKRAGYETPCMTKPIAQRAHIDGFRMGLRGVLPTIESSGLPSEMPAAKRAYCEKSKDMSSTVPFAPNSHNAKSNPAVSVSVIRLVATKIRRPTAAPWRKLPASRRK